MSAERERIDGFGRLEDGLLQASGWYLWGPYVSERQWGTVREDYSADGEAWAYLPHDHARSRAYRWGEDGLAGFCDIHQRLCLAEYELLDTGVFDHDRYWIAEVCYAKADPTDLLMTVQVTNAGPDADTVHVLPAAWFRNTWSWDADAPKPVLEGGRGPAVTVAHPFLGSLELIAGTGPGGTSPVTLFCENETNVARLFGAPPATPYPKDVIGDHVISGAATVNPDRRGTKCAFWYRLTLQPGATAELRLRLRPSGSAPTGASALGTGFDRVINARRAEADEFYAELTPEGATAEEAMVMRQAFAGMLWSKQFYNFDVARWLDGDPAQPAAPASRRGGRNSRWRSFDAFDIMSMPDKWEYPWFAAWDLAFHCVALAHVDPAFAKYQLILLCREWFQHPSGALPAYEWDFGDVNPPVQAWAALEVFAVDGGHDIEFLSRVFDKLLLNFTWWVNREDAEGNNLFEGGFLGLDNIGPIDRSHLPVGGILEQCDATGWMGFYATAMASIALVLDRSGQRPGTDLIMKFLEHFAAITEAIDGQGMWDDTDGLYYDRLVTPAGEIVPVRVRSVAGMIPALALGVVDQGSLEHSMAVGKRFARLGGPDAAWVLRGEPPHQRLLLSLAGPDKLTRLLSRLFDESEFLSRHGLRALSAWHRDHPYTIDVEGYRASIDYEPAESTTPLFGGNSNWRGPIWFPLNYLVISALERYHRFFGDDLVIEYPTGSGRRLTLEVIAADLCDRLISLFVRDADGRRPCFGGTEPLQSDPKWRDNLLFSEYFHGDDGAGLGASHQTGWTGLVADLIRRKHGDVRSVGDVIADIASRPPVYRRI